MGSNLVDPSIARSVNPPNLLQALGQITQIKQAQLGMAAQQQEIQAKQLENAQLKINLGSQQALSTAIQAHTNPDGTVDHDAVEATMARGGFPLQGLAYRKTANEIQAEILQNKSAALGYASAQTDLISKGLQGVTDQPSYNAALAILQHNKVDTSSMSPTYDPKTVQQWLTKGQSIKDNADVQKAQADARLADFQRSRGETLLPSETAASQFAAIQAEFAAIQAQQKTTGTEPIQPAQRAQLGIGATEAGAAASQAGTAAGRLGVERYQTGIGPQGELPSNDPRVDLLGQYKASPGEADLLTKNVGILGQVKAKYPDFDPSQYAQRAQTLQSVGPNGEIGKKAIALNTLIQHTNSLEPLIANLHNGSFTPGNEVIQKIAGVLGKPAPTNFDQLKQYVIGEQTALIRNGGGDEHDIERGTATLNKANSPEQLAGALKINYEVAGGKMGPVNESVSKSLGQPYTMLGANEAKIMQSKGYDPATLKPTTTQGIRVKSPSGKTGTFRGTPEEAKAAGYEVVK
jgi:hypothetical protein